MSEDPIGRAFDAMIQVVTQLSQTTGLMLTEVQRLGERERELSENVAELGLRLTTATAAPAAGHSLRVVGAQRFRTLDELAETLREELAGEVEQLTERIDGVHEKTLRALTDLVERKRAQ